MLRTLAQRIADIRHRLRLEPKSNRCGCSLELTELEDRILYSASPFFAEPPVGLDGVDPGPSLELWPNALSSGDTADPLEWMPQGQDDCSPSEDGAPHHDALTAEDCLGQTDALPSSYSESAFADTIALPPATDNLPLDSLPEQGNTASRELIFVDSNVQDHQQLVSDVLKSREDGRFVDVFLLDGDRDGMEQITEELAKHDDVDAVHIVSHGTAGKVKLGNVWLSTNSIDGYAGDLVHWGDSLTDRADVLFYGCDLAEGEDGRELIEALSLLTGADVAASIDDTGHDSLGGDWHLELSTGPIETSAAFSHLVHGNWHGVLDAPVVVVDTNEDTTDGDTTSIAALLADRGADGSISLREAIVAANNTPNTDGIDEIHFSIDGGGTQTIQPLTALPTVTDPLIIDGTTQPGFGGSPLIELDGSLTIGADGLLITGGNSTIRGLVINRFDGDGIRASGGGNNLIEGNYIGTNVSGTAGLGNGGDGIEVTAANITIGGTSSASRNVISGNAQNGILITGFGAFANIVEGNYIGVDATASYSVGNVQDGIRIDAFDNAIGGMIPSAANIVSGNQGDGISIHGNGMGNFIAGNFVGTDASESLDLGNAGAGVRIEFGSGNLIGNNASGGGNTIAYNQDAGVALEAGIRNQIRGNTLFDNAGLGIDLGADAVTANDVGDGDTGQNDLQNYPALESATVSASVIVISGTIDSTPDTKFEIDFYSCTVGDASDYGEAEVYLGSKSVTTDMGGIAGFTATFTGVTTAAGDRVSATATSPFGNTSEFAQNVTAIWYDPIVPEAPVAPSVDGSVDEVWSASSSHEIRQVTIGAISGGGDLSASWKGLWDLDNLYVLVEVTDDVLMDDTGPTDPWMDDIVEVFIDADVSRGASYDGVNDFHFGFRWNDTSVYTGPNSVPDTTGITSSMANTATGYRLEVAIPWTTLGVSPIPGDAIGMDVQVADDDNGGDRDGKLAWYASSEVSYQDPSSFASVQLSSDQNGSLWLSTGDDVTSPSGVASLDSWAAGDALQLANPRLVLGPELTNGTLSVAAALDAFAGDGNVDIDALHYVTREITIGDSASIDLMPGDLLLSTAGDESFTSANSLSVANEDLFLFRPDEPGDYTVGTFTLVLDDLSSLLGIDELSSISLIERETDLEDTTLSAGDFLFSRPGVDEGNDIYVFHTVDVGENATDGTVSLLIEGTDIGIGQNVVGLELIEQSVEIGGHYFAAGQILATLEIYDDEVGDNSIPVNSQDVFALDIAATTFVAGTAAGNATVVFEGNDLGLDSNEESLDALSLVYLGNSPRAVVGGPHAISEGDSVKFDASRSSDPDDDPLYFAWDLNDDGVYGDVTGEAPTVAWSKLRSHGVDDDGTYTIAVLVRDGTGGVDQGKTTLTIGDTAPTLTTTGETIYKVGRPYTLDLNAVDPGNDTVTSWTINWGDGSIETLAGDPATASHTYTQAGFTYNISASATNEEGTFHQNQLLVPNEIQDAIFRFAATTADYLDEFATGEGLDQPYEAMIGPDGNLYVSGDGSNHVLRYDPATGAFIDEFVATGSGGLHGARGMAFGPDGNLYVSSYSTDEILRFDGNTGAFIDAFVPADPARLDGPGDVIFGPDGNLYVGSSLENSILRYDGITGAFMDEFVTAGSGGLDSPVGITFGSDGNLYVASSNTNNVLRYDGNTGTFLNEFVTSGSGGLSQAAGLRFGPDGDLYVSGNDSDSIVRYDGTTGVLVDQFVTAGSGGLQTPAIFEFVPGHQIAIVTNRPPTADAGGPYAINETDSVTLDAAGSVDPDDDPLTYSWDVDNDGGYGDVTGESPTLTWAQLASFGITDDGTYTIGVQVDDSDGGIDTHSTTITVTNLVPTGNDDSGVAFTTDEDTSFSTGNALTNDTDPNPVDTLSVIGIDTTGTIGTVVDNGDGSFNYDPNGQFEYLSATQQTIDTFTYTVSDDDGGSDTGTVTVTIGGLNDAPTADDAAFSVVENSVVSTSVGSISANDPDTGDAITYAITGGNLGGAFDIDAATGEITVANTSMLDMETTPTFSLTVEVQDAVGLTDTASVTINLIDVNETPTVSNAIFGLDENSTNGTMVGTVSASDPDVGDTLGYTITGGNTNGAFAIDSETGVITVANDSALDFEATSAFSLTVQVQDGGGLTDIASVAINLADVNERPVATDAVLVVQENSANGTAVGTVLANDPDAGDTLTYAISGGNTDGAFAIDSFTGEITVANTSALERETTPTFNLTVEVLDAGSLTDIASVTINVDDVNESPVATDAVFGVDENSVNGTTVGTVLASDPDAEDTLSYAITGGNASGAFAVDNGTGVVTVANSSALDYEATPTFALTVEVSDAEGLADTASVTINVGDINERPVTTDAIFAVVEHSVSGTTLGTVSASDPDMGDTLTYAITGGNTDGAFAIDNATGEIMVASSSAVDYEMTPGFILTVEVLDTGGLNGTAFVTISLTNINETPTVSDEAVSIAENSPDGTSVGIVSATDPDAGDVLTYAITGGNTAGVFAINSTTGEISVADGTALDFETTAPFALAVEVQDSGGLLDTASVAIQLIDVNEAPAGHGSTFALFENSANGTLVGTVTADDPDAGDSLSYSITSGNPNGAFAIDSASGEISVAKARVLDLETTPRFRLGVEVQDGNGLTDDFLVGINLRNVNEAPVAVDDSFAIADDSSGGTTVGVIQASDPDSSDTLTYAIADGNVDAAFAIDSGTGRITVANPDVLDFDSMPVFTLTVQVEDAGSLTDTADVTIELLDSQELPAANDDYLRETDSPFDSTQRLPDTPGAPPDDFAYPQATISHARVYSPIDAYVDQMSTVGSDIQQASPGPLTDSLVGQSPGRDETEGIPATPPFHLFTPLSGETELDIEGRTPTVDHVRSNAGHEDEGLQADGVQQPTTDEGDSPDQAPYDPAQKWRAVKANLVAAFSIATCYLLSKVPANAKLTVVRSMLAALAIGKKANDDQDDQTVDEPDATALIDDMPSQNEAEVVEAPVNEPSDAEFENDGPSGSEYMEYEAEGISIETEPEPFGYAELKPDGQLVDSFAPLLAESVIVEAETVEADFDPDQPPSEGGTDMEIPDTEPEAEADPESGEKHVSAASRLLAGVNALSQELRSRRAKKADSVDETAEEDYPMERRMDRFM